MERINVNEEWRMMKTDSSFSINFASAIDRTVVFDAVRTAIGGINQQGGYVDLWIQDIGDSISDNGFSIESTLTSDEFNRYIPVMLKAIAEVAPNIPFKGNACHNSLKCYYIDEFVFSYDGKILMTKETISDERCGYFCPECGYPIEEWDAELSDEMIECDDCGKELTMAELQFIPPITEEREVIIRND